MPISSYGILHLLLTSDQQQFLLNEAESPFRKTSTSLLSAWLDFSSCEISRAWTKVADEETSQHGQRDKVCAQNNMNPSFPISLH